MQTSGSSGRFLRIALVAVPVLLAAFGAYLYFGSPAENANSESGSVQVIGSESMRPSVTACAEDFMTRHPQADIIIKGGGSGDGVAALLHGMVDIGMSSRELSDREREYAASRGAQISDFVLALDGVTIVVNRANPITVLTIAQLRDIFTGKVDNWRELEAGEGDILPFARAPGSGTASLFADRVMGEQAYAPSAQRLSTNEAIVGEVAAKPGAIGYAGIGALRAGGTRIKVVPLAVDTRSRPTTATPETIVSGEYPLSRKLHLATMGPPLGTAKAFIDFCLSESGQALFQRVGYVPAKSSTQ